MSDQTPGANEEFGLPESGPVTNYYSNDFHKEEEKELKRKLREVSIKKKK